jgi:hypothetical protein
MSLIPPFATVKRMRSRSSSIPDFAAKYASCDCRKPAFTPISLFDANIMARPIAVTRINAKRTNMSAIPRCDFRFLSFIELILQTCDRGEREHYWLSGRQILLLRLSRNVYSDCVD